MLRKIGVDGNPLVRLPQMYPVRFHVQGTVALLQEEDVRSDFCVGVPGKGVVGQPDGPQQFGTPGQVAAHVGILFVHGSLGGYESDDASRPHLVDGLGEEVIVNVEAQLVVCLVRNLIVAEGNVAHGQVEKVPVVGGFKARHGNMGLGVQVSCDAPGNAVQLHAVQAAACHGIREQAEKVAHTHGRLQNIAGTKPHALHGLVNGPDHRGAGIVGVEGGRAGRGIRRIGEQAAKLLIFLAPIRVLGIKSLGNTAPAHVPGKDFLLLGRGGTALCLQRLQGADGGDVPTIAGFRAAHAQLAVRNVEVSRRQRGRFRWGLLQGQGFHNHVEGQLVLRRGIHCPGSAGADLFHGSRFRLFPDGFGYFSCGFRPGGVGHDLA